MYILLSKMNVATVNATKIARQIQLCQIHSCCKSNARRALLFPRVTCNWLTTDSSLRNSFTTTFHQNKFLRKRIFNESALIVVPKRSFVISCSADKSHRVLSQFANVRHFIEKKFSSSVNLETFLDKMAKSNEFQRLPSTVVPKHYNLELNPDLIGFTFTGKVSIKIEVKINLVESLVCVWCVYTKEMVMRFRCTHNVNSRVMHY